MPMNGGCTVSVSLIRLSRNLLSLSRRTSGCLCVVRSAVRLSSSLPFGFRRQRPPGGGRFLTDPSLVYDHNNWDNVQWDEEQEKEAQEQVAINSSIKVSDEQQEDYEVNADRYWDGFYSQHQNRFFKDRHWLFTEFPELDPRTAQPAVDQMQEVENAVEDNEKSTSLLCFPGQKATMRILEVGCGVGNTVIPVLQINNDPGLFVYGCDLSSTAVELLKEHKHYDPGRCLAFVCDISNPESQLPFPDGSLDIVVCIFVLSAIHHERLPFVAMRLSRLLKPGGLIVFRDYGRYDLTQLRFKTGRCLGDNFYVRGDGTKVYFFTQDELRSLFVDGAGLVEEQNLVDRRLQVNRSRQIRMYRVWIQCKFRKPVAAVADK